MIVGIGEREDRRLGHRLEQPQADHLRRHPGRDHRVVGQRTKAEIDELERRLPQRKRLTVGVAARKLVPVNQRAALDTAARAKWK